MSNKVKRKVTVENSKEGDEQPRRPSVFERLGPNAVNVATQPSDRHSRPEQNEKCRNWFRTGTCAYGNTCRYKHDPFPQTSRRTPKQEKEMEEKDLRHKVRTKRDEPKGSRTGSLSPKRVGKRSNSRSRKGEHESKIKSTVVVTRPRSPASAAAEPAEPKKKGDGNWEDDSDDWPMDAAQLDFKEELTLERKRQQLQRELALELEKERQINENVTITKTVSFSESSSSSSSSDSGSISSSSGSSSSSSDEDSDDSSSSSSSSSSSGSRPPAKHRNKKSSKDAAHPKSLDSKSKNDYDKLKISKSKPHKTRSPSVEGKIGKKGRDKRKESPLSPRRRQGDDKNAGDGRSNLNVRIRGPRTPSPVVPRKQRQWAQSSSTDSRSADAQRNRGKRHKKKRDGSRGDKFKSERGPSPPPLSSPNRTALMPLSSSKKNKRDENNKSRRRGRDSPPSLLPPRNAGTNQTSSKLLGNSQRYLPEEKIDSKQRSDDRSKFYSRKEDDTLLSVNKRTDSRDRLGKRNRMSPRKDSHKGSLSPPKDRYDMEIIPTSKKLYPPISHKDDKMDHRQISNNSPLRTDRRKLLSDSDKKRDLSPRGIDSRRDNQFRGSDGHYDKRNEKGKRTLSPEPKKGRDDRGRDYDTVGWSGDHRKSTSSTGRRTPEPRGRQDIRSTMPISQADRPRDVDRKKRKDRDHSARSEESERNRLPSPRRSQSPILPHHAVREIEPLTGNRGRIFDTDVPPSERDYPYGYDSLHDPYDRLLPSDYETDVIRTSSIYPEVYPEPRYRRDAKDPMDRYGQREVLSPRDVLPHRDVISLTARSDEYLSDLPIEDRPYEERWPRGRNRDDWDSYSTLPSAPIPPHVAAALDEDRYGMPRRRRASPEWQRGRMDDRDTAVGGHGRQLGRGQLPRDARSRSPAKGPGSRGSWAERGGRHDRSDNRHEETSKGGAEDRKGKSNRKDRIKHKDDTVEVKKEKSGKRLHSLSPPKENKRRREETNTPDTIVPEKSSYKRSKDEGKSEPKSAVARAQKSSKLDTASPRSDISQNSFIPSEKIESSKVSESRFKDDRRSRNDNTKRDDEFSDWSDGDDDLLNRDDLIDSEETSDNSRVRHKSGEKSEESASVPAKRKEKVVKDPQIKKVKDSNVRTSSRERNLVMLDKGFSNYTQKRNAGNSKNKNANKKSEATNTSTARSKTPEEPTNAKDKPLTDGKDSEVPETSSFKDDTAADVDEYITAESVDYDPISDDELDALIEEPEDTILKPSDETEKSKIVDALDVDWSALMSETKTDFKPGYARRRFTAAHVLSRVGFSQVFAGPQLSEKLISHCQKQLDEEKNENDDKNKKEASGEDKKFAMEHQIAAFHVSVADMKKERINIFNKVGPFRRALCARRDLQIRNFLCKPVNKFAPTAAVAYSPQYSIVDKDLYKQSLELLRQKVC